MTAPRLRLLQIGVRRRGRCSWSQPPHHPARPLAPRFSSSRLLAALAFRLRVRYAGNFVGLEAAALVPAILLLDSPGAAMLVCAAADWSPSCSAHAALYALERPSISRSSRSPTALPRSSSARPSAPPAPGPWPSARSRWPVLLVFLLRQHDPRLRVSRPLRLVARERLPEMAPLPARGADSCSRRS